VPILLNDGQTPKDLNVLAGDVYRELKDVDCLIVLDNVDGEEEAKDALSSDRRHFFLLTSRFLSLITAY